MSNVKSNKKNKGKIRIRDRGRPDFLMCQNDEQSPRSIGGLYAFVYNGFTSFLVSMTLVISFFLQGVYVVYANEAVDELVVVETPATIVVDIPPEPDVTPDVLIDEEDEIISAEAEESTEETDKTVETNIGPDVSQPDEDQLLLDESLEGTGSAGAVASSSLGEGVSEDESMLEDELDTGSDLDVPAATSTDDLPEVTNEGGSGDESTEDTATSTSEGGGETDNPAPDEDETDVPPVDAEVEVSDEDLIGPGLVEPITVTHSDSGYTFSKSECTELASGSFYCVEPKENILDDALFAAPDADGDLEIFLVRDGVQSQVTQNQVDDAAPYYDQNSETIVWHRLVDDRYQIVSYDVATAEETLLTKNATNDMEPTRQGKYTVWQRWVGNNWDIILYDGNSETQISHATAHDIAPYIHGTLVVWNRYTMTGDKTIEMYDLSTETYVTVDDPAGLSVSNPRMVLVYDQMHPNGDVVTKGYDMIAKKFIQLDTLPRDLPDSIPESEPTSETRALIQAKPTVKGDEVVTTSEGGEGEPPLPPEPEIASDPLTLDLTATSTYVISQDLQPVTEFDLVIEPLSSSTPSESGVQATSTE